MESYNQPWTVINKYESEPKTYEYYAHDGEKSHQKNQYETESYYYKGEKPMYYNGEKQESYYYKGERPHYYNGERKEYNSELPRYNGEKQESYYYKGEKPMYYNGEKQESYYYKGEKPMYYNGEKQESYYYKGEKPMYQNGEKQESYYYKGEKPMYYNGEKQESYYYNGEKSQYGNQMEEVRGDWEKIYNDLERMTMGGRHHESRRGMCGGKCCDEEMVKQIKELINILIGAEQSYIQLGFLCMDERLTLVNTSEYFRLCGLRMRWLANGLIGYSARLFNVNEWINNTTFQNWFKVPSKEELATNDYTSVMKTIFKIAIEAENRICHNMNKLGEKMMKTENWMNTECRFEGFKWFLTFVLPYEMHFVRVMNSHMRDIEMSNNGYIFDKCEMFPLVNKIEEFINRLVNNTHGWTMIKKNGMIHMQW